MTQITKEEIRFRGMFMSLFIDIEFFLGDTLTTLLLDSKNPHKLKLHEYVNPNLFFGDKIKLVERLLKREYKNLYNKYKQDILDLKSFVNLRNDFAHKRILINIVDKKLNFIVVNNGRFIENTITFDELNKRYERLKNIKTNLSKLERELE